MSFFSKLFGDRSKLFKLASGGDADGFAEALGSTTITLISAIEGDGVNPESVTGEELLAFIDRSAKDLAEKENGFIPFVYEDEGETFLPYFTSSKSAEIFCGAYMGRENRIIPFQTIVINGADLAPCMNDRGVSLIMDPQTDDEIVLSKGHVDAFCAKWA